MSVVWVAAALIVPAALLPTVARHSMAGRSTEPSTPSSGIRVPSGESYVNVIVLPAPDPLIVSFHGPPAITGSSSPSGYGTVIVGLTTVPERWMFVRRGRITYPAVSPGCAPSARSVPVPSVTVTAVSMDAAGSDGAMTHMKLSPSARAVSWSVVNSPVIVSELFTLPRAASTVTRVRKTTRTVPVSAADWNRARSKLTRIARTFASVSAGTPSCHAALPDRGSSYVYDAFQSTPWSKGFPPRVTDRPPCHCCWVGSHSSPSTGSEDRTPSILSAAILSVTRVCVPVATVSPFWSAE